MKLLVKLNLIFVCVFAIGLALTAWVSRTFLMRAAQAHVLQNAQIMMETAMSMRSYTTDQVAPVINGMQAKAAGGPYAADVFHPQTVPAFAATEAFAYLRKRYPDYAYKEATLNPTNLRDRATDWEADLVNRFRGDEKTTEIFGERDSATGRQLFLAHPLRVGKASCLQCHSTPDAAPPAMVKVYGPSNGFGWKFNEVIGAQIVSVPVSLPVGMANQAFRAQLISLISVFALILLVLNAAIYVSVLKPVRELTSMADDASRGKKDIPELPIRSRDEIGQLGQAFNRMQRSLAKAMTLLDS